MLRDPAAETSSDAQKKYPLVRFWTKASWKVFEKANPKATQGDRGGARCAEGINVNQQFIEDENGKTVDGHRAKTIREHAHSIFSDLLQKEKAPASWLKASDEARVQYEESMKRAIPEMGLCENHWKANQLAVNIYPSWIATRLGKRVKVEQDGEPQPPRKRSARGPSEERRKRARSESEAPPKACDSIHIDDELSILPAHPEVSCDIR